MDSMDTTTIIRIVAGLVFLAVLIVPAIFYLLTLSNALKKCSPASRTMEPGMVWLLLIPLVNIIFNFFVVIAEAQSLGNEFRARGIAGAEPEPGKSLGIAMCVCAACGIIPFLGIFASLVAFVLWIMYWVKIAGFSRMLDWSPAQVAAPGAWPQA